MPFCEALSNPSFLFILEHIVKRMGENWFQLPEEEGIKPLL